ncbi:hypothetical protein [Micavibrio aeruginosavorus]|uniref:Uncharacterized protein n=1 Tax=Micavibrio aeruginosavorus (strain ARL-13) TaxID=856793 RepID=G2KSN4_MICAA|nr:hypothetical protein [Micavibrio aeruginosavorus]AEP09634.1 hypothetical protein MICA_1312 [Micavibrio aeruginosavorus ARL-13]
MIKRRIAKRNIRLFFIAPAIAAILILIMGIFDPTGVLHAHGFRAGIMKDMRQQAAGVMNINPNLDSIILGTSVLENTSSREAERVLGGAYANISMSGSSFYERHFALDRLLKTQKIKTVIYSLDDNYLSQTREHSSYPVAQYDYLYNWNTLDNIKIYQDFPIFKCLIKKEKKRKKCMSDDIMFDRPNMWMNDPNENIRFGGLDHWFAANNNQQVIDALSSISSSAQDIADGKQKQDDAEEISKNIKATEKYIDDYVLSYVRNYPRTEFHLVFPPYSRIKFAQWHQGNPKYSQTHEAAIRYLAQAQKSLSNLYVYGYEDMKFIDDIANYKDTGHYHERINTMMLQSIHDKKSVITPDNAETYIATARRNALSFDLIGLGRKIDAYLKTQKKTD